MSNLFALRGGERKELVDMIKVTIQQVITECFNLCLRDS